MSIVALCPMCVCGGGGGGLDMWPSVLWGLWGGDWACVPLSYVCWGGGMWPSVLWGEETGHVALCPSLSSVAVIKHLSSKLEGEKGK